MFNKMESFEDQIDEGIVIYNGLIMLLDLLGLKEAHIEEHYGDLWNYMVRMHEMKNTHE